MMPLIFENEIYFEANAFFAGLDNLEQVLLHTVKYNI